MFQVIPIGILPQEKRQEKNDKITKKGYKNGKKEIQCRI
jgi:hypothetical protein